MSKKKSAPDIVTELREHADEILDPGYPYYGTPQLVRKAADEIERLRARLAEREAELDQQTRDCISAIREAQDRGARLAEAEALLREAAAWRVAIECVAPELGGTVMTLNRIDAFLSADSATHREDDSHE